MIISSFFSQVVIGSISGKLAVYNESFSLIYLKLTAHSSFIWRIKEAQNGLVVTASYDGMVKVWNSRNNWNLVGTYTNHSNWVMSLVCISNDVMASGDLLGYVKIWSISLLTTTKTINAGRVVTSLALLNNGFHLASGHDNGSIKIWNINNSSQFKTLSGHTFDVNDLKKL